MTTCKFYCAELLGMANGLRAYDLFREAVEFDDHYRNFEHGPELLASDAMGEVQEVARGIGTPVDQWPGRCTVVVSRCLEAGVVTGRNVYGIWDGPILPVSRFYGRPFTHHGWVKMPDGRVFDPTRWCFGDGAPYLWCGMADEWYDEAGARTNMQLRGPLPEAGRKTVSLKIRNAANQQFLQSELKIRRWSGAVSPPQLSWVLKTPPTLLPDPKSLYEDLQQARLLGLVGIDYQNQILENG